MDLTTVRQDVAGSEPHLGLPSHYRNEKECIPWIEYLSFPPLFFFFPVIIWGTQEPDGFLGL